MVRRPGSSWALLLAAAAWGGWVLGGGGTPWRSEAFSSPSLQGSRRREAFAHGCRASLCKPRPLGRAGASRPRSAGQRREASNGEVVAEAPAPAGTVVGTSANIVKGMVGSGILSLAGGVAMFTRTPQGLGFAVVMLTLFTLVAAYSFQLVAWVSAETDSKDFGEAWAASVGERYTWVPRFAVIAISAISCIIYAMLLGDLLASILRGVLSAISGGGLLGTLRDVALPWCQKGPVLVALASGVLLPLCLQENFANLSFTSKLGLAAAAYLAGFVVWRSLDGSYLPGGRFFSTAPFRPLPLAPARSLADAVNFRSLVLLANFGMAYMNHGMAPPTYQELNPGASAPSDPAGLRAAKLRKYRQVTLLSFLAALVLCASTMVGGFRTFGPSTAGNLLGNYATTDVPATVARACVMFSVLCGFPLNFVIMRVELDGILAKRGTELSSNARRLMTTGILAIFVVAALMLGDLGQVQAVVGSVFGSFIVYLAPAIMARALRKKQGGGKPLQAAGELGLMGLGLLVSVVGLALSLKGR